MSTSVFIKHRRQCYITLLESIGARRGELSLLKVEDVLSAASLNASQLKLPTLKQEDDSFRMIPIPKVLLPGLLLYIRVYRRKVLRETVGLKNDDGYFFISGSIVLMSLVATATLRNGGSRSTESWLCSTNRVSIPTRVWLPVWFTSNWLTLNRSLLDCALT